MQADAVTLEKITIEQKSVLRQLNDISRFFWEKVIGEITGNRYKKRKALKDGFDRQSITFDNSQMEEGQ